MCVLFFILSSNPSANGYKLILANNRDEYYTRPTKVANFWANDSNIISGIDLEPGRDGGTWLGMTKSGKIGVLLNILQPVGKADSGKRGRGFLVPDFLKSSETGATYLENIYKSGQSYNTFNLVTIEMNTPDYRIGHYTNTTNDEPVSLNLGEYGFGNSRPETAWRKVGVGKNRFSEIVNRYKTTDAINELVSELMDLLNDDTTMLPDPQLESQAEGRGSEFASKLSALKVVIPTIKYGTRTNTVIIVDSHNKATYIERTMKEPVDPYNPVWVSSKHVFQIA